MKRLALRLLFLAALAAAALGAKAQTLSVSPSSTDAGTSVTATWSGITTPTSTDWIGLYSVGAPNNAFVSWQYTDGNAAGNAPFLIPVGTPAGTYELRLFSNNGFTLLATSSSFTVTSPPAATVSATPSSADAGAYVTASWTNIVAPTSTDWIGLYTTGAANNAFVSWHYTTGSAAGNIPFLIPVGTAAGSYELRLFSNDGFTLLATSSTLTVTTPPAVTLSATPSGVMPGGSVTAAWTNIVTPTTGCERTTPK